MKKNNPTFKNEEVIFLEDLSKIQKPENLSDKENNENSNHMVYFEGGAKYLRLIEKDNDNGTSATLLSRLMISAEGGLIQKWTPIFHSYFGINFGVTQIMQSDTAVVIGDDTMATAKLKTLVGYTFLNFDNISFHGEAAFLINTPFNNEIYASQIGTGYEAAFVSSYETKDWELRSRLYYSRYITNIPPVTFDYTEIGITLRLSAYLPQ